MTNRVLAALLLAAAVIFVLRFLLKPQQRRYLHGKAVLLSKLILAAALLSALWAVYVRYLR